MTERYTYKNGTWLPEASASISIFDSQFMFGDAVFEMHRTFNHKHFLLDEHIDRLWTSMKYMQIPITKTKQEVKDLCDEAIKRNPLPEWEEYRFMINVSRGPLGIYKEVFELEEGDNWNQPTWIINIWPLSKTTKTLAHFYDEPADARVTVQRQIPSQYLEAKVKNRSRMHYMLANLEMKPHGPKAVPLMLDDQGFVCESSGANFLMMKDWKLIVPQRRNMLRGCSMQFIIDKLCPAEEGGAWDEIEVVEKNLDPYDILEMDEAMFTGTFNNLLPCNKLNGQEFGTQKRNRQGIGLMTAEIVKRWNTVISRNYCDRFTEFDFINQIRDWKVNH